LIKHDLKQAEVHYKTDEGQLAKNKKASTTLTIPGFEALSGSGWESNPPGTFSEATLGLKPNGQSAQSMDNSAVTETTSTVLPSGLPESATNDPDLVQIAETWPKLSNIVKAGIVAMVQAATTEQRN